MRYEIWDILMRDDFPKMKFILEPKNNCGLQSLYGPDRARMTWYSDSNYNILIYIYMVSTKSKSVAEKPLILDPYDKLSVIGQMKHKLQLLTF